MELDILSHQLFIDIYDNKSKSNMIRTLPLVLLLFIGTTLFAQEYRGKLIHNDGTSKEVSFLNPYSKNNYKEILYLHYGMEHELYAQNFKRAEFSKDLVYQSIEIKTNQKVWARVHFESETIKLFLRYNSFYVEVDNTIYDISKIQSPSTLDIPKDLSDLWQSEMNGNKMLPFKTLKKLLVQYHKKNKIDYHTYFNKAKTIPYLEVGLGANYSNINLLISPSQKTNFSTVSPAIFINGRLYFSRLLKQSFVSLGIGFQKFKIEKDISTGSEDNENFHELNIKFQQISIPMSFNLTLLSKNEMKFYMRGGAKIYFNIGENGNLVSEYQIDKIVRTENSQLKLAKKSGFTPLLGLVANKKIGKSDLSFLLQYEKNMESGNPSNDHAQIEFSKSAITVGAAIKF
ncbi:outer membrane beta-barrel protein [Marinifilum fragile]|uniref:outer membrane beta-barrel protein n=1 Tax=Marinifilum fragile TaxID=570161 RepID=UPI002AA7AB6E|nr:outer membrane beta-barrel protein [Marinifilum fragile]